MTPNPPDQPPFLILGKVLRPQGVRGDLRIAVQTAYPDRVVPDMTVYLGADPLDASSAVPYRIVSARKHQQFLIIQLEGVTGRDAAELLREQFVLVQLEDAVPLEEDEFYLFQVIGLAVHTTEGEHLGQVTDVIETGANDVYVVQGPRGEVLLPAIDECIHTIDIQAGTMVVQLLDGLLND
jgi:16S rRNA processing protein RimM